MMTTTTFASIPSPLGRVLLVGTPAGLCGLYLADHGQAPEPGPAWERDEDGFAAAIAQLYDYFAGRRTTFDLEVDLSAGTAFQQLVWEQLQAIPYGQTISYGELARRVGQPNASRAVGTANGRNPVSIVVPCHRVIATGGRLGGYGWGVERKSWLLDLERGQPSLVG